VVKCLFEVNGKNKFENNKKMTIVLPEPLNSLVGLQLQPRLLFSKVRVLLSYCFFSKRRHLLGDLVGHLIRIW